MNIIKGCQDIESTGKILNNDCKKSHLKLLFRINAYALIKKQLITFEILL